MFERDFTEKQCVGCGKGFTCFSEMLDVALYCTDSCEENHSIFKETIVGESENFVCN